MICEYCKQEMALIVVKSDQGDPVEKYKCFNCEHEEDVAHDTEETN